MALTQIPIELSSTSGIVDNSTGTAITIDASGNVDVTGTVTADGLTVDGTSLLSGAATAGFVTPLTAKNPSTDAASSVKIALDAGGTTWGEIGASYNSNNPYMAFFVRSGSEKLRITDAGNVGIGTASPSTQLQIVGSTFAIMRLSAAAGDNNARVDFGTSASPDIGRIGYNNSTNALTFRTNGADAVTIDSSQNVGIGVTPSTWSSAWTALDIGDGTLFSQNNRTTGLGSNIYFTGSAWFPKETGEAALYQISQGTHNWYINSSVTSGVSFTPTTKMTLDASGNLLVGKTSVGITNTGFEAVPAGTVSITRADTTLQLNRLTTDGNIVDFYKDGTAVGSIGSNGGDSLFIQGRATGSGLMFKNSDAILPTRNGSAVDATINLGRVSPSAFRFKDLWLSGGVYLGGTGAANYLDDYEEGTWTPVLTFGGGSTGLTTTVLAGEYTKVGRLVYIRVNVRFSAKGSSTGSFLISGLPFTSQSMTGGFSGQGLTFSGHAGFSGLSDHVFGVVDESATTARLFYGANVSSVLDDTNFTGTSGNYFSLTGCYEAT